MNKPLSSPVSVRPSACPGLLRIVPALDGGICRIKLAGGVISSAQARAVAQAAQRYAGGVIEATNRANLQIRGIGSEHGALIDMLLAAGLGPSNPDSDDVRNLLLSPTAGLDPHMLLDVRPLAGQILAALENTPRFHELSPKFAVSLDGGEGLAMLDHPHDLWLSALDMHGEQLLAFGLAGCPARDKPVAALPLAHGLELVLGVLQWFLDTARPEQTRMRQVLAEVPVARLFEALAPLPLRSAAQLSDWRRPAPVANGHIGVYPQAEEGRVAVGGVAPLGRLDPSMLTAIAQLAEDYGDGSLRLTPWQSVLLPDIPAAQARTVLTGLESVGLLCSTDQALAHLVACTGSSDCAKGLADTKGDARLLAGQLQQHGISRAVHLSACQRSCAAAHRAPATLLAVSDGHYDLYFRDAGQPGFGALQARDLTIEAAGAYLIADSRSNTHD